MLFNFCKSRGREARRKGRRREEKGKKRKIKKDKVEEDTDFPRKSLGPLN